MHPSKEAEGLMTEMGEFVSPKVTQAAQVWAILAVADALQEISASIDALKAGFLSVEIVSVSEGMVR